MKTSTFHDDQLLKQAYEKCDIGCPICQNRFRIDADVCYCGWKNPFSMASFLRRERTRDPLKEDLITKCPKCRKEIEHLNAQLGETIWFRYRFDNSGYSECERMGDRETTPIYFHCPKCEELIAETEEEAKKILNMR